MKFTPIFCLPFAVVLVVDRPRLFALIVQLGFAIAKMFADFFKAQYKDPINRISTTFCPKPRITRVFTSSLENSSFFVLVEPIVKLVI